MGEFKAIATLITELSGDRHIYDWCDRFKHIENKSQLKYLLVKYFVLAIDIDLESAAELSQSVTEILEDLPTSTRQCITEQNFIVEVDHITPVMGTALRQIIDCPFQGKTRQIYLESKCLELISLRLEKLKHSDQLTEKLSFLKSDDVERIHFAKTILTANFSNPPSLTKLSRQVGVK